MKEKSKHMNIPKIRFKGFEDTWKNDKIGNIGSVLMCKRIFKSQTTSIGDIPFYKIGTFGSTADAFISENLFNEYKTRFSYPQYGDILLSAAGTIGRIVEYKGEKAYFQDSNIVWVKVNGKIKNQFLKYIYSCIKWNGLEGSTIKRLYNNNILETAINYPSPEEQQKIASYFQSLDSLIQITSKKLASLKQIKAASLQSMFPQEGETVPKVRFKGFEGEWSLKCVSELLCERNELSPQSPEFPLMAFIANNGITEKGERYDRSALVNDVINKQYKRTYYGDFIYSSNNLETGSIGLNTYGKATISPVYSIFYCTLNSDSNFVGYCMTRKSFIKEMIKWRQGVMYGQWRIHEKDFLRIKVLVPSLPEQQKIGAYFRSLDRQISLQTQRLEKLKQIKAACLDKMFV